MSYIRILKSKLRLGLFFFDSIKEILDNDITSFEFIFSPKSTILNAFSAKVEVKAGILLKSYLNYFSAFFFGAAFLFAQ